MPRFQTLVWYAAKGGTMTDERTIEARIYERLSKVIDPELGRSVTDLGMIAAIDAIPVEGKANTYEVRVEVELTVEAVHCRRLSPTRSTERCRHIRKRHCCRASKSGP